MTPPEERPLPVHPAAPAIGVREEAHDPPPDNALTRRTALKLMSATALLASGAVGCTRKPVRRIVSVHDLPEYQKPGVPLHYASTFTEGPYPYGMMVKAVDGRPIKVEGLPDHPLGGSTSDLSMQATLLALYDPERLRAPTSGTDEISWEEADRRAVNALRGASRVLLVTRQNLGPSERALVEELGRALDGKLVHRVHEPAGDAPRRAAWKALTGRDGAFVPDLAAADVVVSIAADFLGTDGPALSMTNGFSKRRGVRGGQGTSRLSRLYVAEGAMTVTGSNADHRIPLRPRDALAFVQALRKARAGAADALATFAGEGGADRRVLEALVSDLGGGAVVLAGAHLPPSVHAAVALLNDELGAYGSRLRFEPEAPLAPTPMNELLADLEAGPDVALLLGVNPVYDSPALADALAKVKTVVAHGLTRSETLEAAALALPSAHNLESWNDAAPTHGVRALCQPQIRPLYEGRQEAESLFAWAKALRPDGALKDVEDWHAWLRKRWTSTLPSDISWDEALRRGWVGEPSTAPSPPLDRGRAEGMAKAGGADGGEGFDLVLLPDPSVYDGRFAGNAWLQELPNPVTKLVWDSAAALHPATAASLGVSEGDWIRITVGGRETSFPVLVQPGTAKGVVAATLGRGRRAGAGVGNDVGTSAAPLLGTNEAPRFATGAAVTKDKSRANYLLVRTQGSFSQHGREVALAGTTTEYDENPSFVKQLTKVPRMTDLSKKWDYSHGYKWEMAIDLSLCTGCNACVIACQAENNISVVGKEECGNNREMQWMRIDRYESGDESNPDIVQQPMLCQHCENAPCEMVCPVNAAAHSPEGLNEQVYNRCVGTRYCNNNCPYKVRRFNYLAYAEKNITDPVQELHYNPQVTVRSRGIMEKCTFCLQRINAGKFAASNDGRTVRDGEIKTACQQACPASAIVFGNVNDKTGEVAAWKADDLAYHALAEIGTRPGIAYLAKVRNPHPTLADRGSRDASGSEGPEANGHEAGGHGG